MRKVTFETKMVNDKLYARNGEEIEILNKVNDMYYDIKFKSDGETAQVYSTEINWIF